MSESFLHPIKEKVTPVDPACAACPVASENGTRVASENGTRVASADGTGVASENGTRVAQVDGAGVQTKQNKWKNL